MVFMQAKPATQHGKTLWIVLIIVWGVLAYVGYSLGPHKQLEKAGRAASIPLVQNQASAEECDSRPPASAKGIAIDPAAMQRIGPNSAWIDVENRHHFPVMALLTNPQGDVEFQAIYLLAQDKGRLAVPSGEYGLTVLVGTNWCNLATGFTDGEILSYAETISAGERAVSIMKLLATGDSKKDMMFSFSAGGFDRVANNGGSLELSRMHDGHFHVAAQVNGYPITFLIDTGATIVAIPYSIAQQMGLDKQCLPARFITAAGAVQGCKAIVDQFSFAGFHLRQLEVSFNPGGESALLGMNVLSQFRIQQTARTMLISAN